MPGFPNGRTPSRGIYRSWNNIVGLIKNLKKICAIVMAAYLVLSVVFYFLAGQGFRQGSSATQMVNPQIVTGELLAGQEMTQQFVSEMDTIDSVTLFGATFARENSDMLNISVRNETGAVLTSVVLETAGLNDNAEWTIVFSKPAVNANGQLLTLSVISERGEPGNAVTFYYGNSRNAGRLEVQVEPLYPVSVNRTPMSGELCFSVTGTNYYAAASYYWPAVGIMGLSMLGYLIWMLRCEKAGKRAVGLQILDSFSRYRFLLRQLVARDFKSKYKRSVFGMLWSFLNPLLTMMVLYIVFSTMFKNDIANFPVYLLSGIIVWSFFSETTGMCLSSVTGNASLITKVYVPKYMYPFSRAVSSLINFGLSLIPLLLVLFITQTKITTSILLLPFPIVCLFFFALGMGMMLASAMVFFRDSQFLWGVVSMLWMYLTPIFYDVSIIPAQWIVLYKLNPLYHIVRVFRILLIQGVSPEPKAYLLCLIASFVPFALGLFIFRKTQDRFVLYL